MRRIIKKLYYRFLKRNKTFEDYSFLKKSQYYSNNQLQHYQLQTFQKLWLHAVVNTSYYQEVSKKIGIDKNGIISLSDMDKIPFLTKDIVRQEFISLKARNLEDKRFLKESTSGSTGSNFHFLYDANKRPFYNALEMRKYEMMKGSIYDRELVIWGTSLDENKKKNTKFGGIKEWINNRKVIFSYNLSDEGIWDIYNTLRSYRPVIIKSYPSILMTICAFFKKHNLNYQPKFVHIGGEKLYDFQRVEIENTFNCPVYDYYAARDMKQIAVNCEKKEGLHVFMENVIFEVVNEQGEVIDEGEGEIVVTDLHNYAMPFIRYKIGDRAIISKNRKCPCGRNLQLVDEIVGRTFETIEFPNGNRVGGTFWTFVMKSVPGIKDFQVIQEDENNLIVNYTPDPLVSFFDFNNIVQQIHRFSGDNLNIVFQKVNEIPVTKAGKMQFVITKKKKNGCDNVS